MDYLLEMQTSINQESQKNMTMQERLDAVVKRMMPSNTGTADAQGQLAADLLTLVDVAAKIAELDNLASKAAEVTPSTNSEAKKWQELSLQTLQFSRDTLVKQQQICIGRLGDVLGASTSPTVPSTPASLATVAALPHPAKKGAPSAAPVSNGKEIVGTLRKNLESLQEQNPKSILIVRRINRLGFQSAAFLEKHFAQFGDGVLHTLVAHSRVKPSVKRPVARVRPAGIGFVVMANPLDVESILGTKHVINGVTIQAQRYEVRSFTAFDDCQEDDHEDANASTSASDHDDGRDPSTTSSDHEDAYHV